MTRLESIDATNWEEFTRSPKAVLMLGKTDCAACRDWTEELTAYLEEGVHPDVRFGKLLLDQRGLADFKKANPWLKEVQALPFNVLYKDGEPRKKFAGAGVERLTNRLARLDEE